MPDTKDLAPGLWLTLLMLVVCLPRVTIDLYLPALPAMADALQASDAQLQLTLTLYMAGYALCMLISGPLSDRYGRRPVLLAGTLLYLLATLACACAENATVLIIARLFQALGGCCGTVIGRVIVRDRFTLQEQTHLLSRISMGMALSPMIAPILGSLLEQWLGWRGLFVLLSAVAAATLWLISRRLPETHTPQHASTGLWRTYARLLRERFFLRYALTIGLAYCSYFPFIAESSTLLQRGMHLSPMAYAQVFALTVAGYWLGSNLFKRGARSFSADRLIAIAIALNLTGSALLIACTAWHPGSLAAILGPMVLIMFSVGLIIPACQLAVLQPYGAIAGTASGLFFFVQMAITALCSLVTGLLSDGSAGPLVIMTTLASLLLTLCWRCLRDTAATGAPYRKPDVSC